MYQQNTHLGLFQRQQKVRAAVFVVGTVQQGFGRALAKTAIGRRHPAVGKVAILRKKNPQRLVDAEQVTAKATYDPAGLLNPGKLRGWLERPAPSGV